MLRGEVAFRSGGTGGGSCAFVGRSVLAALRRVNMSDTLWGVVIGGVIGSLAPFIGAYFAHQRWKKEKLLEHLKSERERMSQLFEKCLKDFMEGMSRSSGYPINMIAEFMLMPKDIYEQFDGFMTSKDKSELERKT